MLRAPRDLTAWAWGFQKSVTWQAGESRPESVCTLEQCVAVSPYEMLAMPHEKTKEGFEAQPHPVGMWRVSATVVEGDVPALAKLTYGSGDATKVIDNVILPLIAYIPGYANVEVRPQASPQVQTIVNCTVVPVYGYSLQQVGQLFDASGGAVVLPQSIFGLTAYSAATYTPTGAPAPIAVPAGATVDVSGQVTLDTGVVVGWHEL